MLTLVGLFLSSISLVYTFLRNRFKDIKELENRLTRLEEHQFTPEDRTRLRELDVKVGIFWGVIEREAPKILRQRLTPHLDALLAKAEGGISKLSRNEQIELKKLLEEQYDKVVNSGDIEDPGRALVMALYKGVLEIKTKEEPKE